MNFVRVILICALLAPPGSTQSVVKSILFTDPKLDPQRCSLLFSFLLQRNEFSELPVSEIKPIFLNALKVPAPKVDLENQLKVITNETIFVEIGPNYFYGPSFFPHVWRTNMAGINRTRLVGFGLSSGVLNSVIGAAFEHLTSHLGVAKLAYIFDNMDRNEFEKLDIYSPTELLLFTQRVRFIPSLVSCPRVYDKASDVDISTFQFLKDKVGQFHVYHLCDFVNVEDALSQILVDGANVLVLNIAHQAALELLHKAQEKGILQQPFHWLVFNAGVTLSGEDFHVHDTNFFAVEFSTNGKFIDFTELSAIPKPITPKDLVFRDMAVVALQKLAKLLKKDLRSPVPLITSTVDDVDEEKLQQTWNFYSYIDIKFDLRSLYKVQISTNGSISGTFQTLNPPPERELLLHRMRRKIFRLGTVVVPPVITEETDANGVVTLRGAEIVLAKELLKRLNVSYNITVFDTDPGEKVSGRWTGIFGHLERWNIDLLVGPFSATWNRMITFRSTTPIRSIGYSFMYYRPSLSVPTQVFQFVVAFEASTWLLIFLTTIGIGVALALVHNVSPNSLSYSIHPAIIFVFGYLFQGVRTRPPSQASSQILIVVWWFFCLILVIAFCANYASYRSFTALETLPTTVPTLLHQEYYKYAYINGSSMEAQMRVPLDPSIYTLYTVINKKFKNLIPPNRSAGVDQTIKGGFALLDESPFIEYYARKYCLETSLTLWHGAYVFYTPKLLPYYKIINDELRLMIADGTVDRIYKRTQEELLASLPKYCGATINDQAIEAMRIPLVHWSDYSIEFAAALGIFVISLIGLLIVLIIMVVEFLLGVYKKSTPIAALRECEDLDVSAYTMVMIQLQIINNGAIFVEIGPDYFYGPSFFPPEWKTNLNNVNRSRIVGFDLTFDVQNEVLKAAFDHLTSDIGVVKLAYFFDYTDIELFQFLEQKAGQFLLYQLRDFSSVDDALSRILVDGANVLVLNVGQQAALKLLRMAQEKNILQQPFYWLVFNAGITLSGVEFFVADANFFAVEFSTNGRFAEFPELSALPKPITPKDLIFRDTAIVGLQELARLLNKTVPNNIDLITTTFNGSENTAPQQEWKFYSYEDTKFDSKSVYEVLASANRSITASFQALKQPPSRELLLHRMRAKPLRLGTIKVPPVITEETDKNGSVTVNGPEIALAKALLKRLNVSYSITVFDSDIGEEVDGRWTGIFGHLEEWDIDLLVGPFSETWDRSKSFLSTTPIRSITYNYMYRRPSLRASLQIFQFVVAFDGYTWLLIILTAVLFGGVLTLLHKISPNTLSYSIHPSMLFVFGYLFQHISGFCTFFLLKENCFDVESFWKWN
ncbi:unnamed protein product [Taenia asiatica]|uniref:PBPe domain-containing protein n=1 Tax=Taenia asiatica TaxID=60517 RepID=A0A158R6J2_TAEAS|nr:unnamed protein product [Taenia asiatica]